MRYVPIIQGEYYHVFNRGNRKQTIFEEERDWIRFLFLVLYLQSPATFPQVGRTVTSYVKSQAFDIKEEVVKEIVKRRFVELIAFAFMPNHFHLIVREKRTGGISQYMQRSMTAYAKYFNTKYDTVGHLFQGPYQAVHIKDDNQLSYVSAYIHRNPRELRNWRNREHRYPWSSYQDYVWQNRWGGMLVPDIVLERCESGKEYKEFVEASGAKEVLDDEHLI